VDPLVIEDNASMARSTPGGALVPPDPGSDSDRPAEFTGDGDDAGHGGHSLPPGIVTQVSPPSFHSDR
jgi:hypothetical protein